MGTRDDWMASKYYTTLQQGWEKKNTWKTKWIVRAIEIWRRSIIVEIILDSALV